MKIAPITLYLEKKIVYLLERSMEGLIKVGWSITSWEKAFVSLQKEYCYANRLQAFASLYKNN